MKLTATATAVTMIGCALRTTAFAVGRPFASSAMSSSRFGHRSANACAAGGRHSVIRMMSADAAALDFAKSEIEGSDVVVFSKSFCPFCKKTKNLLNKLEIDAKIIELDEIDNGSQVQDALMDISGQRTVPNVFIKGEHIGGNDDVQRAAKAGTLQEKVGL
jgi:glutaredoxin 3